MSGPSPMAPRIAPDPVKWGKRFTRPELAAAIATFGPVALEPWSGIPASWFGVGLPARPFDHVVDDLTLVERQRALELVLGAAAGSDSAAVREAAAVVEALVRSKELTIR